MDLDEDMTSTIIAMKDTIDFKSILVTFVQHYAVYFYPHVSLLQLFLFILL